MLVARSRAKRPARGNAADAHRGLASNINAGIASPMTCTRYHSLIVAEAGLPAELEVSAWTTETAGEGKSGGRTIMGLRHRELPIEGVQFHPESVLTVEGKKIIANFLKM